ncbi:unnamed protein product [Rotaria sordida]|uniref:Uncharacterized protein n=1 Tax=Rotaria sordida TaxID=392033 RepID=A0A813X6I3_9BILA|nr:unnamed protein product [Rotaria sordida]CAF1321058.1 unnamed protein product [Rotaria sordida]
MEDDNLILLLNTTNNFEITTPIQQKREPLVEIADNDDHDSIIAMTCLNDRIPSSSSKRHFDDIKLVRPSSATSQGSHSKKQEKPMHYAPHLTSGGNRNSNDNLIQSSIDVTLSSNSSPGERQQRQQPPIEDELDIITIVGPEDNGERENENPIDTNFTDPLLTPLTLPKPSIPSQVHSTPDIQISRFDKDSTTSKTAFARSQLAKRFSINQGQQRSIPIQSLSNTTNNDLTSTSEQQQITTSLAATVAASVAVSVAQPFLKLQNDFEQRMNTVLNQIQQQRQQQKSYINDVVIPVTHVQQTTDTNKLLNDCVDTRIKYMEKVQEQQQQTLKQLADLVQTKKSKSKSPVREHIISNFESDTPQQQRHFLDTLVGTSSPPVRLTKTHKKQHTHKKSTTSPSSNKRPSRVTGTNIRTVKIRSPVTFKEQPPNSHFNIEPSLPYDCSVCDRSRSRSRSRSHSPTKGLSPNSSYPRPYVPIPRPPSIMSDGFIPSSTIIGNALQETYPPFDKYLNNSIPPLPLQPTSIPLIDDNLDLHERIKQIDEAKNLLDENYLTLQRRQNDVTLLKPITDDSLRVQRLVEQCVKQVTRQVHEEVKLKLEQDDIENEQKKPIINTKKRPTSKTQLAFDRHSTVRTGQYTSPIKESSTSTKPYSDAFMEAVYGRSLYEKIKKSGKQPYFKLKQQTIQQAKQPKQIEEIPVRDTGLKPSPCIFVPPRCIIEQPSTTLPPPPPPPVYEPQYYTRPDGVILLGPPQIRDTRSFQPTYIPSACKLTPHILPSVDIDPSKKKVRFGQKTESIRVDLDGSDEQEDDDDGQGIEIPGYHDKKDDHQYTYDGPRFPPTIPHDEGYRNRQYDTLQSGAIDWLEQELIARFMSQLQCQQKTIPIKQHRDIISARSSTSSSSDDQSLHCRLLDLLGQDGFQLIIDMGQPIDQDLIQALTREVLEERITQMIGFRSPRESIHVLPPPAPPPRITTPTTSTTVLIDHQHHWPQENSVPTPQPTPPQSPPPIHHPRVVTPEITGQEISTESEPTTPRSITPQEDLNRPLPSPLHHSVGTPTPSRSPSPPSTPRIPQPPPTIEKRDASTMATIEMPPPPPPVIIPTPRPPSPPPPRPKPKTPSPVSSTSSSSSSPTSSSSLSTFSVPYSSTDSPFSDHMWFEDRSEGQVDVFEQDRPQTELILRQAQRLLNQRRQYSSITPAGMSFVSPSYSPAGGTHTLSVGEVPPQYPVSSTFQNQNNGHTTPTGSDESNNSGKSEGEAPSTTMNNHQQAPINIKIRRPNKSFLGKKNNRT